MINAAIRPVVARYLENIERRLADAGVSAELLVMQSSGGVFGAGAAARKPVFMVESGPAAGVIASANLGSVIGTDDVISFDMGGTTAKVGLIQGGTPSMTKDYSVGSHASAGVGGLSLSGYPVRTPVIDLVEIGAGGGSIAWVDSGGMLRVGPRSAGADPGPVCYRQGGTEPTVTDANVVLGRLNPAYFLGGEIALDVDGARRAIAERCAEPLGLDAVEAANGIVEIANAAMVNALHLISVQRGYDPRDFVLVGFGGAGPVHANAIQRDCEVPTLVVPQAPGIFSATGLLGTDLKRDSSLTLLRPLEDIDVEEIERAFAGLEETGAAELAREGLPRERIAFVRQVDMRYVGQSFELTIPLRAGRVRYRAGGCAPRALPRRARPRLRLQRPGRGRRARQPPADDGRADRQAAASTRSSGPRARRPRRSTGRCSSPRPAGSSSAPSTTGTPWAPVPRSPGRQWWRSSTRRWSSIPGSASEIDDVGNLVIRREHA